MRQCTIPLPDSEVKIIGFGAYHGSAKTETAELIVLEGLIEAKRLGYYLPEVDFCLGYYFNEYLLSGDDDLLKRLVLQYGERVPQEKSMECYDKWRSLRKILCENNYRITVIGTDALYSYEFAMRYLSERMEDLCNSYNGFTRMRSVYEKLLDGISVPREEQLNALKGCLNDYKAHEAEMLDRFGARFDLEHLMDNINRTVCREERESTISIITSRCRAIMDSTRVCSSSEWGSTIYSNRATPNPPPFSPGFSSVMSIAPIRWLR